MKSVGETYLEKRLESEVLEEEARERAALGMLGWRARLVLAVFREPVRVVFAMVLAQGVSRKLIRVEQAAGLAEVCKRVLYGRSG